MSTEQIAQPELQQKTHASLYFWLVFLAASGLWILNMFYTPVFWQVNQVDMFMFILLNIMAEQTFITLPEGGGISASFAIILAALLLFNGPIAVLIAVTGALITMGIIQQRSFRIAVFNAAQYALTYGIAGLCILGLNFLLPPAAPQETFTRYMIFGGVATVIYLLINIPLVNGFMKVREGNITHFKDFFAHVIHRKEDLTEILQTLFFYPIAVLVAYSYGQQHNPMIPLVLSLLVFGSLRFIEQRRHLEKQRERMQALYHMTRKMAESSLQEEEAELDPRHVFNHLFDDDEVALQSLFNASRVSVYRVEWEGKTGQIRHQRSEPHSDKKSAYDLKHPGILQEIAKTGKAVFIKDMNIKNDLHKVYDTWRITYQCLIGEPIKIDDKVMFVLMVFRKAGKPFQEEDLRLIKLLVNAFDITLKNIELRNRLQAQAIKDGLMNIYNHRYLKGKLEEEVARAIRYHKPLSLIIADVDYFKKFNDAHGHLLGDQVLREMAQILSDSVRETDIVARYGGEELAILLPETPLEAASDVAERIRKRVASYTFRGKEDVVVPMSLSIGVSCLLGEPKLTASELIVRTDTALYRAKHQGRNQICQALMKDNSLVIQTYSQGPPPQPADQTLPSESSLPQELKKIWEEHQEKSLSELQRVLRHDIEHSGLNRSMTRYFEKQWVPMVPALLSAFVHSELTADKQLRNDSPLAEMIEGLESLLPQKLPRTEHLRLLQHLLLKVYRYFLRQMLSLPVTEIERKNLFNHGFRLIMILQNHLFGSSLAILTEQKQQYEKHYGFLQTLLQSMPGGRRSPAERLHILARSFPEADRLLFLSPGLKENVYVLSSACPTAQGIPHQFEMQSHSNFLPRIRPLIIEVEAEDLPQYLNSQEKLSFKLSQDTFWVIVPLWHQEKCHGILVLIFDHKKQFAYRKQQLLLKFAQDWADLLPLENSL